MVRQDLVENLDDRFANAYRAPIPSGALRDEYDSEPIECLALLDHPFGLNQPIEEGRQVPDKGIFRLVQMPKVPVGPAGAALGFSLGQAMNRALHEILFKNGACQQFLSLLYLPRLSGLERRCWEFAFDKLLSFLCRQFGARHFLAELRVCVQR